MLHESAYFSLIIQIIIGIVNIYGLNIDIPKDKKIIKDILQVEFVVQIVEFIFYIWMINNLTLIQNITPYRYFDWIITTPTMLITLTSYLSDKDNVNLKEYLNKNKNFIIKILVLNMFMLLSGLAGELNFIDYNTSILVGFIPFIYYFKMIYDKYLINNTTNNKVKLYWFFFIIWTIYGIVAFLPYEEKNIAYNIIDLFSKNFFSLFLVIMILNFKKDNLNLSKISKDIK